MLQHGSLQRLNVDEYTILDMKVLLTGALGNIGESTLIALSELGYEVRCFDIKTEAMEKKAAKLLKKVSFDLHLGDIRNKDDVVKAVAGVDTIIHLAAILPPLSDKKPDLAREVNIGGTRNIVEAAQAASPRPKVILASSVSIHGPTMHRDPPRRASDPLNPTDVYTHTKIECEKILRESDIPWTILRLSAVPPLSTTGEMDPILFEIPLDQRIEFVHTRDVGVAFANAVAADLVGETLLIGGGESQQMLQRDFIAGMLGGMGLELPPESAFRTAEKPEEWYYTDWLDTTRSQEILKYQQRTYEEFIEEFKKGIGFKRHLAKLFKGQAMKQILAASPYYKEPD